MDHSAARHLARMELELQGAREPAHAERMTKAAQVFWEMCAVIAKGLGSEDPDRDGRAMAVMLDGLMLDRLAHPQEVRTWLSLQCGGYWPGRRHRPAEGKPARYRTRCSRSARSGVA